MRGIERCGIAESNKNIDGCIVLEELYGHCIQATQTTNMKLRTVKESPLAPGEKQLQGHVLFSAGG